MCHYRSDLEMKTWRPGLVLLAAHSSIVGELAFESKSLQLQRLRSKSLYILPVFSLKRLFRIVYTHWNSDLFIQCLKSQQIPIPLRSKRKLKTWKTYSPNIPNYDPEFRPIILASWHCLWIMHSSTKTLDPNLPVVVETNN